MHTSNLDDFCLEDSPDMLCILVRTMVLPAGRILLRSHALIWSIVGVSLILDTVTSSMVGRRRQEIPTFPSFSDGSASTASTTSCKPFIMPSKRRFPVLPLLPVALFKYQKSKLKLTEKHWSTSYVDSAVPKESITGTVHLPWLVQFVNSSRDPTGKTGERWIYPRILHQGR